ncbi:N-acyl amino acid synthase FeeM domain-containing protein [Pseudobacteriovorax antillogorgiicola]|uniref:Acetyltransferase (GNAT) domain-containing protein n=1 Tax=Pseudobacteriovorax antillogorgiicola TaxID=1513793 RepID=A0A1Y6CJL0_9BACT|nr:GNAT family N-acyltransferase [Pseudobacteriovorax antillogorgiicola]TCS46412.1 acetyltransferase (GNAT) family protein [Pseudobacteriovorax antillogorgiicola]SMF68912.1 Acetyltransferase (GNAT) domain-containing protein [Pseudobacteriovorax antillogorgiicola]
MAKKQDTSSLACLGLYQWPPQSPQPKLTPKLDAKVDVCDSTEMILCRFWLDRASYNLLHLRTIEDSFTWDLGEIYNIQFLVQKGIWTKVTVRVAYTNKRTKRIGLRILNCHGMFKHHIGQLLFEYNDRWTPKQLYKLQFPVSSIKDAVVFKTVSSSQEYDAVVNLRTKAYALEGKIPNVDDQPQAMGDEFDERSIIVIAKHGTRVVASLRLIITQANEPFEHEHSLVIPRYFPKKQDIIEITRVCTHPDYRAGDLLEGLFQYSSYLAMAHSRDWIIGSSTDQLLSLYEKLGFQTVPVFFEHRDFKGQKHTLFFANKHDIIFGRQVNPVVWTLMYQEIYEFAKQMGFLGPALPIDELRIKVYQAVGKIVRWVRNQQKQRLMAKFSMNEG